MSHWKSIPIGLQRGGRVTHERLREDMPAPNAQTTSRYPGLPSGVPSTSRASHLRSSVKGPRDEASENR